MEIIEKLNTTVKTIETIYDYYKQEILIVNRNYQRKLVWSLEEKKKFIDSISNRFPIPLFLVAEIDYDGKKRYEIIDGMQRLEAIVSFIEGNFNIDGRYFDLDSTAATKYLKDHKSLFQRTPLLDRKLCRDISGYEIPLSVTLNDENGVIEEIFRRINSNGKHLSRHEIRQAGILNEFSHLVRSISENLRGDSSHDDILPLNKMKLLSLNNKGLDYGIQIPEIFWCKNGIITIENIRESRDEELVAYLLLSILTENSLAYTARTLDNIYTQNESDEYKKVLFGLRKYGREKVEAIFSLVFDEIRKTIEESSMTFANLIFGSNKNYVNRAYQVVFSAFYELLIVKNKEITNYNKLSQELKGVGKKELASKLGLIRDDNEERERSVNLLIGILEKHFIDRKVNDPTKVTGILKVETLINKSSSENNSYDFKIGFHCMDEKKFNEMNVAEVVKTLTAIGNRGKGTTGYILVGIADKDIDATWHKKFYKLNYTKVGKFNVCGIQGEINKGYKDIEHYRRKIEGLIKSCKIEPSYYTAQILENIEIVDYYDKPIVILKIEGKDDPIKYEGSYYVRQNTSTVPEVNDRQLWSRFLL
ncbi:GmrSD restriction endonuclease domain-containing protein [Paenibacillus amylolyticus]|uniref:GmrSD restriction endonuclease domain-containing protein n=1 Tax=Paenibacillus amylolyticus TaxID=1451 RepID=UPI00249B881E|nr:DUF262 domain-containing protein [Paenibacillus amylolyticus]WFA88041.1 DUF262 domain-containing protein [Paenibacillus amylolyticus]